MKREDSTTLKIGDDFSKAFAPFEEHLARLCIHGECRRPCVMWDDGKKRCSLKHQARLMHRAPKNNGAYNVPADKDDSRILSLLEDIYCGVGVEAAFDAGGGAVIHVPADSSKN